MPSAVFTRTGNTATVKTTNTLLHTVSPNHRMTSGARATIGVAYRAAIQPLVKSSKPGDTAMASPSSTPTTQATPRPGTARSGLVRPVDVLAVDERRLGDLVLHRVDLDQGLDDVLHGRL